MVRVPPDDPDASDLKNTVEELRKENEKLRESEGVDRSQRRKRRWKSISSWVLLVLACILSVLSVFVVFVRNEVLNTSTYVSTVTPLASNPAIQTAVAKRVSDKLVAQVNLDQRVKDALPPRAGFLVTPITNAVENAANEISLKLVQSPKFQKLWVAVNLRGHKQVVALLIGSKTGALQSSDGKVTIDLSVVEASVRKELDARGITVFDKVPTINAPTIVLFQSTQLVRLQGLIRLLNRLYILLPIVTLLLFAAVIALTANRRRGLVRAATGLALSMALLLILAAVARNQYLNSLSASQSKPANAAVIDTVSAFLLDTVRTVFIVAAVIAIVGVIAGNAWIRAWVGNRRKPSWMTDGPAHGFIAGHRKGLQWGILGLGLLILVVWNEPTAFVAVVVLLITLALIGLVGLFAGGGTKPGIDTPGPRSGSEPGPGPSDPPEVGPGSDGEGAVGALGPGGTDKD